MILGRTSAEEKEDKESTDIKAGRLHTLAQFGFTSYEIESLPRGHKLFMYAVAECKWIENQLQAEALEKGKRPG